MQIEGKHIRIVPTVHQFLVGAREPGLPLDSRKSPGRVVSYLRRRHGQFAERLLYGLVVVCLQVLFLKKKE